MNDDPSETTSNLVEAIEAVEAVEAYVEVRRLLERLDGTPEAALSMLTGLNPSEISDLGGVG